MHPIACAILRTFNQMEGERLNEGLFDALWGLIFWALVGTVGAIGFGTIEGVALWRIVFLAGYGGYLMGCYTRRSGA